jgi:hypothetical protein
MMNDTHRTAPLNPPRWSRRDFMKASALSSIGLALAGSFSIPRTSVARALAACGYAEDGLAAIAITDDCLRLALHSGDISPSFKHVLIAQDQRPSPGTIALTGGILPASEQQALSMLQDLQVGIRGWRSGNRQDQELALLLGWIVHRGAREVLETASAVSDTSEAQVYRDAAVIRLWSGEYSGSATSEEVTELLNAMVSRAMIRFHTAIPDYDDVEGWLQRMIEWRKSHHELMQRWGRAVANPGARLTQRYVTGPNFISQGDPVIGLAARLRDGETVGVDDAILSEPGSSLYAQALARGFGDLRAASDYFDRRLDSTTLMARLRIA